MPRPLDHSPIHSSAAALDVLPDDASPTAASQVLARVHAALHKVLAAARAGSQSTDSISTGALPLTAAVAAGVLDILKTGEAEGTPLLVYCIFCNIFSY